jgi:hypothetical protein
VKSKNSEDQRRIWREGQRRWRAANPEKNREIQRRYRKKRRERERVEHELVMKAFGKIPGRRSK